MGLQASDVALVLQGKSSSQRKASGGAVGGRSATPTATLSTRDKMRAATMAWPLLCGGGGVEAKRREGMVLAGGGRRVRG